MKDVDRKPRNVFGYTCADEFLVANPTPIFVATKTKHENKIE